MPYQIKVLKMITYHINPLIILLNAMCLVKSHAFPGPDANAGLVEGVGGRVLGDCTEKCWKIT